MRGTLFIMAAVVTAACGAGADSAAGGQADGWVAGDSAQMERWRVELIEADRGFEQRVQKTGLGAWLHAFGSGGMMISGGAVHAGQEGIRQAVLPLFADPAFEMTWDPTFASVGSGNLGYTVGTYEMTLTGEDGPVTESGAYLTIWRRTEDGAWHVEADIGSPGDQ